MDSNGMIRPGVKMEPMIRELMSGKDFAMKLLSLLQRPLGEDDGSSQMALQFLDQIQRSFDLCLAGSTNRIQIENALKSCDAGHYQVPAFSLENGTSEGSEDSIGTKKRTSDLRDRRGCYKRRKPTQTWVTVTPTTEDGQAWRKYGQKVILNAKFPRSYFRCTHKYDQNCKAAKQVQMMEDNSGMYKTTYIGSHTCNRKPIMLPPLIIPDDLEPETNNFNVVFKDQGKEEVKDQADTKSDLTDNISFSSLPDNSSNMKQADHMIGFEFSSSHQDENQDEISRMYSLGMDDDGVQSEMELLVRGSIGFPSDYPF